MSHISYPSGGSPSRIVFQRAFTLIEMLVVIVLIAILMGLAVPSFLGSINASKMTQAGSLISGTLVQAQDFANARNRLVEVRFYKAPAKAGLSGDAADQYRYVQLLEFYEAGDSNPGIPGVETGAALPSRIAIVQSTDGNLPDSIVMSSNPDMSTVLNVLPSVPVAAASSSGLFKKMGTTYTAADIPLGATEYKSIVFGPTGPMLSETQKWFVTVVDESEAAAAPAEVGNFCTLMLDPITGQVVTYRP